MSCDDVSSCLWIGLSYIYCYAITPSFFCQKRSDFGVPSRNTHSELALLFETPSGFSILFLNKTCLPAGRKTLRFLPSLGSIPSGTKIFHQEGEIFLSSRRESASPLVGFRLLGLATASRSR